MQPNHTPDSQRYLKDEFGLVIARWESLRLIFNILLVSITLLYTAIVDPANFRDPEFWMFLVLGALICNFLFMTGPALDGYLTWYGVWTAPIALLLFSVGTGYTIFLAVNWLSRY